MTPADVDTPCWTLPCWQVLELIRIRERWRFRSILRLATTPSAEARASQSASCNTLAPGFSTPKPRGPRRVRAPFDDNGDFPRVADSVTHLARWRRVVAGGHIKAAVHRSAGPVVSLTAEAKSWSQGGNLSEFFATSKWSEREITRRMAVPTSALFPSSRRRLLGAIRLAESLGAWQIRKRLAANHTRDRHTLAEQNCQNLTSSSPTTTAQDKTDMVTNRTDPVSCVHHRVQSVTPGECESLRKWSHLESGQHPSLRQNGETTTIRSTNKVSTTAGLFRRQLRDIFIQKRLMRDRRAKRHRRKRYTVLLWVCSAVMP